MSDGAARFYARFRPVYPQALFDDLLARVQSGVPGVLVDLACGNGEIAIPLHEHFSRVLASDFEPDMIEVGRAKATARGVTNVEWRVSRAEDLVVGTAAV